MTTLPDPIDAIGYRLVHGGPHFKQPVVLDPSRIELLRSTVALAPLHQGPAIATIVEGMRAFPDSLHLACFDTAFHSTLPIEEKQLPIPKSYFGLGIQRYGFHGLSYQSIANQLPAISEPAASGKCVVCHLGSGSSICGMVARVSRYTSMGFTPQDGLIMGTRSGRVDPGLLLYWLDQGMTPSALEQILTKESGLLGISGTTSDMRGLESIASNDIAPNNADAELAINMYCRSVAKEIAMAAVAIGGLDAIVFTAGIGENSPHVRKRVIEHLHWLGATLDDVANQSNQTQISNLQSPVQVLRVATDEQSVIARALLSQLDGQGYQS